MTSTAFLPKPLILLVDDEDVILKNYAEAFRRFTLDLWESSEIETTQTVEDALQRFQRQQLEPLMIIIDSMMPHGPIFSPEESQAGMLTGVALLRILIEIATARNWAKCCFTILTNHSKPEIEKAVKTLKPAQHVPILEKIKYPPRKLALEIDRILKDVGPSCRN